MLGVVTFSCIVVLQDKWNGPSPRSQSECLLLWQFGSKYPYYFGAERQKRNMLSICLSIIQVSSCLGPSAKHPHVYTTNCPTPNNIALPVSPTEAEKEQGWWQIVSGNGEEAGLVVGLLLRVYHPLWVRKPNIWVHVKVTSSSLSKLCFTEIHPDFPACICWTAHFKHRLKYTVSMEAAQGQT